jgi:exodeoxyribonuclease VII small subunit
VTDERYTFEQAKIRLEEIAALARKKDTSLEKSLDLLEEGVRLANICTELVDHTDLSATAAAPDDAEPGDAGDGTVAGVPVIQEPVVAADAAGEGVSAGDSAAVERSGASDELDDGLDEPAGMDDAIEDVEGGATEEYDGLDA